jgi:hypothetical protein
MVAPSQFFADSGYCTLKSGVRYHRIAGNSESRCVLLVSFSATPQPAYDLQILTQDEFLLGKKGGLVKNADDAVCMPPWLKSLEGKNLDRIDLLRDKKMEHSEIAHKRHFYVAEILQCWPQLLLKKDFIRAMNSVIRGLRPTQNETRVRLWFFTYLAFAQNLWVLLPAYFNSSEIGDADRPSSPTEGDLPRPKRGRPSADGSQHGYNCDKHMADLCVSSFKSFPEKGKPWSAIYAYAADEAFGCISILRKGSHFSMVQPEGKPYPSPGQFKYHVEKFIPPNELRFLRYGKNRTRNRDSASLGSYAEELGYLMEKFEVDAFTVEAHPSSVTKGVAAPRLYVVRIVCVLSRLIVGIGFGYGSEDADAYKSALFCACVDKVYFCSIFGMKIVPEKWVSIGLGLEYIPDRGAGSCDDVVNKLRGLVPVQGMPPSSTPQSHGTIESSHPKTPKNEDVRFYKISSCNAIELAKKCITEVIEANASACSARRLTLEMAKAHVVSTPMGLWNYYESIGRTAAQSVDLNTAIRLFLTPVNFKLEDGQLILLSTRYTSKELEATGLLDQSARGCAVQLDGYALRLCVRKTWVCIGLEQTEVELRFPYRTCNAQKYVSLSDLEELEKAVRSGTSQSEGLKASAKLHTRQIIRETIPGANAADQTRKGRPQVRTNSLKREVNILAKKKIVERAGLGCHRFR